MPNPVAPSLYAKCDKPSGLGINFMKETNISDLPNEFWVPIKNYESHYLISSFCRIKSINRLVPQKRGTFTSKVAQLIKIHFGSDGYLQVRLTNEKGTKTLSIHRLMALSFNLPNPLNLPEINHIDGVKTNCLLSNLEWSTRKDNMIHAVEKGLRTYKGKKTPKKDFSTNDILYIYSSTELTGALAKKLSVTKSSIQRIKSGKTYSRITQHGRSDNRAQKLTLEVANEIRCSNLSQREICIKYKVSKGLVYNIKNGISYNGKYQ